MRKFIKIAIVVAILIAIAFSIYLLIRSVSVSDILVYKNVKITNISLQNWGDDFVYLDTGNGIVALRVWNASGLIIGRTYNVYHNSWTGKYIFKLVS